MKIIIETECNIEDDQYWDWVGATLAVSGMTKTDYPLTIKDFRQLLREGTVSYKTDLGYTKAKTTYRIKK